MKHTKLIALILAMVTMLTSFSLLTACNGGKDTDGDLAMRYIDFLSDRIRFLNRRIATLTAGSAERRLAAWLDTVMPDSTDRIVLPFPVNRLADTLGLGRASLYRAFDDLTASGYLTRDGKTVILHDRTAMRQANGLG